MKNLLLIPLLLLPLITIAQELSDDFKVTTSKPFDVVDAKIKEYVAVDGGIVISVKATKEEFTIQKFDANQMKELQRREYTDFPKYTQIQKVMKIENRVYVLYEVYNKKQKTFSAFVREVDVPTCQFKKPIKLLTTRRAVAPIGRLTHTTASFWGWDIRANFEAYTSFDESKVLIRYRNKPENRRDSKNYDDLGFYVFDNEFNKVWGREVQMPYTEKEMDNMAFTVTNEGTGFMLARINESKSFEVITVTQDGLENKKLEVQEGLVFDNMELEESADGNILAAGYYNNGTEVKVGWTGAINFSQNVNGLYIFEFDNNGNVLREHDYPFDLEFIQKYLSDRQKNKAEKREDDGKAGINDLVMREFHVLDDGSKIIVGEVHYTRREMWILSMDDVTHFGNIVIMKIDKEGELVWKKKLPKNQATLQDQTEFVKGLGMSYAYGNDGHYMIFADNRKNATLDIDEPSEPHKGGWGGYLSAFRVDDVTGEVEKHLILDLTDINGKKAYQFYIHRIFKAMPNTFLLETYIKGKEDWIVKMELVK